MDGLYPVHVGIPEIPEIPDHHPAIPSLQINSPVNEEIAWPSLHG